MTDEELHTALDGLFAYDTGCTGSGIHDETLRSRCIQEIKEHSNGHKLFLSRMIRDMWLSEEALIQGYGIADVIEFVAWLDQYMNIQV